MSLKKFITIKRIFLLGILIRLLVMPFFAHDDLFAEHRRAEQIVCEGKSPLSYSSFGVRIVESIFTKLSLPVVPCSNLAQIQYSDIDVTHLNRMLFFFKVPYLLFELAYWIIIWNIFKKGEDSKRKKVAVFLALNPVAIYSIYMFGRFEAYNLFLSALILFIFAKIDIKKIKLNKAIILISALLSLLLTIRFSYVLLIPALLMTFGLFSLSGLLSSVSLITAFLFLKEIPVLFAGTKSILPETGWIESGAHVNYFFQAAINQGFTDIYISIFVMAVIFIWWFEKQEVIKKIPKLIVFSLLSSLILFSYYATSTFHPQYLTWTLPFILVLIINDKYGFLWKAFWLLLPFYFIYIFNWGNDVTFGLAAPLSVVFKSIKTEWFFPIYNVQRWVSIAKTVFSAFSFYIIYYLFKQYGKEN